MMKQNEFRATQAVYRRIGDFLLDPRGFGLVKAAPVTLFIISVAYLIFPQFRGPFFNILLLYALFLNLVFLMGIYDTTKVRFLGNFGEALVKKKQGKQIKYYAKFGTVVKEFKGTTPEEARKMDLSYDNIKYELLIDKSLYTMGLLIPGATGAGKTVTLDSCVITPAIQTGSGFIYVEGKGDRPISEGILARIVEHGREDDAFFLDFGAVLSGGFSHSVAPLAIGDATTLQETMTNLITIMTGDNSWVSDKALELMQSVLFVLVPLRDLNLFIDVKYINKVRKCQDLIDLPKVDFNLTQLGEYISVQRLIDLVYAMRALYEDPEFVKRLKQHPRHAVVKNYEKTYLNPLMGFLRNHSIDIDNLFNPPVASKLDAELLKQINYGITPWQTALLNFGNEAIYGRIFNREYADFSFLEAMRDGKIVIISLPSLQNSPDKNQKIGKFITALIKNALGEMISIGEMEGTPAQKSMNKRFRPTRLPYTLIFDEVSNYGSPMFGQISSMCRSIGTEGGGIGMVIAGQSKTDLDRIDDNKQIEAKQLLANLGIAFFLNLSDEGYAELANKLAGKEEYYTESMNEVVKRGEKSDDVRNLSLVEKERFTSDFFAQGLKKQTGEGVIIINSYGVEKIVSNFYPTLSLDYFKLNKPISEAKLFSYFMDVFDSPVEEEDDSVSA